MVMEELIEEVRKVITENHLKGSRKGHKKAKKGARADGIEKMSQTELDKKLTELEERISLLTESLQENTKDQCFEWNLEEEENTNKKFVEELMDYVESSY